MPLSDQAIVQVATGSTGGTNASSVPVTFPVPAKAGNSVMLFVATSFVSVSDYLAIDGFGHPTNTEASQFTASPILKPNTPRVSCYGVYLLADTSAWQFDWVLNSTLSPQATGTAWLAVEIAGLVPLWQSGTVGTPPAIPWEPNGNGNWWYEGGATLVADTGDGTFAQSDYEVLGLAAFAAWVPSSRPPAAVSFVEGTTVAWGGWTALAPNVRTTNTSTPNVGLDVAYKVAYGPGQFDCIATYGQAPGGIGLIHDVLMSDFLGPQRTRSSLTAQVMAG